MKSINRKMAAEQRARRRLESVLRGIDKEERKRKPKPPIVKGPRTEFLEKYKVEGYDKAKEAINSRFGKEVYNDIILKQWIEEDGAEK